MPNLILEGYIEVSNRDLDAVKAELPNHIRLTREETGCLIFNVEQNEQHENRFDVYEVFESKESFEQHQERVRNSNWGRITRNVKRYYKIKSG